MSSPDFILQHQPKPRVRQWAPKAKTGCTTCRRRRVKCGEEKPVCKRCASLRLACAYSPLPQGIQGARACGVSGILTREPRIPVAPAGVDPASPGLELNHYFGSEVSKKVGSEFTSELWRLHLPAAAQNEAPIWHASNFVASLWRHGQMSTPETADRLSEHGFRDYSIALQHMIGMSSRQDLSIGDKTIILATNLLLLVSRIWSNSIKDGLTIASNTVRLVQGWDIWDHDYSHGRVTMVLLAYFFIKVERVVEESFLVSSKPNWGWRRALLSLQRKPISSSVGACIELEMIYSGLQALVQNISFPPTEQELSAAEMERDTFHRRLRTWTTRFEKFQESQLAKIERSRNIIIQIRQTLVEVLLKINLRHLETSWDEFEDKFARATLMIELLDKQSEKLDLPLFKPMILQSLHFMARSCRSSVLRARMVAMMNNHIRTYERSISNVVKQTSYTEIIDAVIRVEESGWYGSTNGQSSRLCETGCIPGQFICNHHRVVKVSNDFESSLNFNITIQTVDDLLNDRPGHVQLVAARIWS